MVPAIDEQRVFIAAPVTIRQIIVAPGKIKGFIASIDEMPGDTAVAAP